MLLIACPYCEENRPEAEFRYAGEAHLARTPDALDDDGWTGFLYARSNPKGLHFERWRHISGCGRFFNAVRHTVTDKFVTTYQAGEARPDLASPEFADKVAEASR